MKRDDRGSMPFAVIAVTLLIASVICAAAAASYERNSDNMASVEEQTEIIERSSAGIVRHIERGLGEIILGISTDLSLGGMDNRAAAFEDRAASWLEYQFPIADSGIVAELLGHEIGLTAQRLVPYGGDPEDGYVPAYLKGTGTVKVSMKSQIGGTTRDLEITTDGSYGLPLAVDRAFTFDSMAGDDGITVGRLMEYQLTCLAQKRVLDGYGSMDKYGPKGTMAIITQEDVVRSYENALDAISAICFRCPSEELSGMDSVDLADALIVRNGEITLDLAYVYSQTLASAADMLTLKWYDYLCGDTFASAVDIIFGNRVNILGAIKSLLSGGAPDSREYIAEMMDGLGIRESHYRYIGGGRLSATIGGHEVEVEAPEVDLFAKKWIREVSASGGGAKITKFIREVFRMAALDVGLSKDIPPITMRFDPGDEVSFAETLRAAIESGADACEKKVVGFVGDRLSSVRLSDPFYGAVADAVAEHADSLLLEEELLESIRSALDAAGAVDVDDLMTDAAVEDMVRSYRMTVFSDIAVYEELRNVPGGQPGVIKRILAAICGDVMAMGDTIADLRGRMMHMVDDMCASVYMSAGGAVELPEAGSFQLADDDGSRMTETLSVSFESSPAVLPVTIVPGESVHTTDLSSNFAAAYSTAFSVRLEDRLSYVVEGTGGMSAAMGEVSSRLAGSVSESISLVIPVSSGWPLAGVNYSASTTVVDDLVPVLIDVLEPYLEPLMEIMRILSECSKMIAEVIGDVCTFVAEAVERLLAAIDGPMHMMQEWFMDTASDLLSDLGIDLLYAIGLDKQSVSMTYCGYTLELSLNGLSMLTDDRTVLSATLSGPLFGMDAYAGITLRCKGDLSKDNITVTGKCGLTGDGWKVAAKIDPFMKHSKHMLTVDAVVGKADIDIVLPDMVEYNQFGVALSSVPGIGEALSNIPLPALGITATLDAGVDLKYQYPTQTGLVINEVEVNPPGEDRGSEWVELYNNSRKGIDLEGYTLTASSDRRGKVMALSGEIGPGELLVIKPSFIMVNSAGGAVKKGEILTLKDPEGGVVDKTPRLKDDKNDGRTWHRDSDGSTKWEFGDPSQGIRNSRSMTERILTFDTLKSLAWDSVTSAFDSVGDITDAASLQKIIEKIVKGLIDRVIEKSVSRLVEASVYFSVAVHDMAGTAEGGIRVSLRADSELAEDVLKYLAGKLEQMIFGFKNPYRLDAVSIFTENIDLDVTVHAGIGFPKMLARGIEKPPRVDLGVTFRANLAAITSAFGKDTGKPGVEFGVRVLDCPIMLIPRSLSPDPKMSHDLWLLRAEVTWRRAVPRHPYYRMMR